MNPERATQRPVTDRNATKSVMIANITTEETITAVLTATAMACFAANSLLTRVALGSFLIDPASFTLVRTLSTAAVLTLIVVARRKRLPRLVQSTWHSSLALSCYLVFFSLAYVRLRSGTGTLILFGSVQLVMLSIAISRGERLRALSWVMLSIAASGLLWLVAPGLDGPDPIGCLFMTLAGVGWGTFFLLARSRSDPLDANAASFLGCLPFLALPTLLLHVDVSISQLGFALAVAAGAITSALGYVAWHAALRNLQIVQAAAVQLSVPVFAMMGGSLLLDEPVTLRLALCSIAVLGGIAVVMFGPPNPSNGPATRRTPA